MPKPTIIAVSPPALDCGHMGASGIFAVSREHGDRCTGEIRGQRGDTTARTASTPPPRSLVGNPKRDAADHGSRECAAQGIAAMTKITSGVIDVQLGTVRAVVLEGHATASVCLCPGAAAPSISRPQALRASRRASSSKGGREKAQMALYSTVWITVPVVSKRLRET